MATGKGRKTTKTPVAVAATEPRPERTPRESLPAGAIHESGGAFMTDSRLTGLPVAATATRAVSASNPAADGTRDARE